MGLHCAAPGLSYLAQILPLTPSARHALKAILFGFCKPRFRQNGGFIEISSGVFFYVDFLRARK